MEERHKYGIRKSIPKLTTNLEIEPEVCDILRANNLLHELDLKRIINEGQPFYKSNRLLVDILLHKSNKNAYDQFIHALDESHQWHLVEEVKSHSRKWSELVACKELTEWLEAEYERKQDAVSSIQGIADYAGICGIAAPPDRIKAAIANAFENIQTQFDDNDNPLKIKFVHVRCKIEEYREKLIEYTTEQQEDQCKSDWEELFDKSEVEEVPIAATLPMMKEWGTTQVCGWLDSILENSKTAKEAFIAEEITGKSLAAMEYGHHKMGKLSDIKVGTFTEIIIERNNVVQAESTGAMASHIVVSKQKPQPFQTFRPFGVATYSKGYMCGAKFYNVGDLHGTNLLLPLHLYVDMQNVENAQLHMGKNILKFACACLNDRVNGTIHFGVSEDGIILGLSSNIQTIEDQLSEIIGKCFTPDQANVVKYCLSRISKVEVRGSKPASSGMPYVIELDVIPYVKICKDSVFFVKMPSRKKQSAGPNTDFGVYSLLNGVPTLLEPESLKDFISKTEGLSHIREEAERKLSKQIDNSYLKEQLVELLCLGDQRMQADSYPVLLLSGPVENIPNADIKNNFSFIKDIKWKAVFDFDSEGRICNYLQEYESQNMRVLSTEEFDTKKNTTRRCESLKEEVKGSVQIPWIFSNGNDDSSPCSSAGEWLRNCHGFREFVNFLVEQIPEERAIIVIMIMSDNCEIITTASCEICSLFPDQYVILTENENAATRLQQELVNRKYTSHMDIAKARSVVGIPWMHVNAIVENLAGQHDREQPMIPSSYGTCKLNEGVKNQWTDLEIICANECDRETSIKNDDEAIEQNRIDVERNFYHGAEITWWNFWYKSQVMQRDIHPELKDTVEKALTGRLPEIDDADVARITVYHQPGAGGTTSARQILWELHKTCRCAVVTNISDSTVEQVFSFFAYEENPTQAKPVLLLLDNMDNDRLVNFISSVDHKSKEQAHLAPKLSSRRTMSDVYVVLLICKRTSVAPNRTSPYDRHVFLQQELSRPERMWMKKTHECLEKSFKENKGPDPKYLIAFNVLREGFDSGHIREIVSQLVSDIKVENEKLMLKYLAFLNSYDFHHRPVPVPIFDNLLLELTYRKVKKSSDQVRGGYGHRVTANKQWELRMSHPTKILVVEGSSRGFQGCRTIGIIHPALSKELYTILSVAMDGKKQSTSEVVHEFFNCQSIFGCASHAKTTLFRIVKDVLIQRIRDASGRPQSHFSMLIDKIKSKESPEVALEVLEKGHSITGDPIVAQQISRFYLFVQNWKKAETYADIATTDRQGKNSYMWDTYAQVFKKQLVDKHNTLIADHRPISPPEALEMLQIAHKAIIKFKKEQSVSDEEKGPMSNTAGFFGEVKTFVVLMGCLAYLDVFFDVGHLERKDLLRKFITEKIDIPPPLKEWENVKGVDYISILKDMRKGAQKTLNRIEDEDIQLREGYQDNHTQAVNSIAHRDIVRLNREMASYFGEETDEVPSGMNTNDQCEFRRRRVISVSGMSMRGVFDVARTEKGEEELSSLLELMIENIKSNIQPDDYRVAINIIFALLPLQAKVLTKTPYATVVEWSRKLYESREKLNCIYLEIYLFFAMLNWPLTEDSPSSVTPAVLDSVLQQWRSSYLRKYPRQADDIRRKPKKETVLFFFANETGFASVANYENLRKAQGEIKMRSSQFWRDPYILNTLRRFRGKLNKDGDEVSLPLTLRGNTYKIKIPTSLPKREANMLNKNVYFAIGFSWAGPKAYDVDLQNPTLNKAGFCQLTGTQVNQAGKNGQARAKDEEEPLSQWEFMNQIQHIKGKIRELNQLEKKQKLTTEEARLRKLLKEEEKRLVTRRKFKE